MAIFVDVGKNLTSLISTIYVIKLDYCYSIQNMSLYNVSHVSRVLMFIWVRLCCNMNCF